VFLKRDIVDVAGEGTTPPSQPIQSSWIAESHSPTFSNANFAVAVDAASAWRPASRSMCGQGGPIAKRRAWAPSGGAFFGELVNVGRRAGAGISSHRGPLVAGPVAELDAAIAFEEGTVPSGCCAVRVGIVLSLVLLRQKRRREGHKYCKAVVRGRSGHRAN